MCTRRINAVPGRCARTRNRDALYGVSWKRIESSFTRESFDSDYEADVALARKAEEHFIFIRAPENLPFPHIKFSL